MSLSSTKKVHDRRRKEGICIQNKNHGPIHKGGRCLSCWIKKLAAEAKRYREVTGCELTYVPIDQTPQP